MPLTQRSTRGGNAARTLILALGLLLPLAAVRANTLAVVKLTDDGSPGTLRAAIAQANTDGAAGTYDAIVFTVIGTINLTRGELDISAPVTIAGEGAADLQIDGNHASRVFSISGGTAANPVIIADLAVQNGKQNSGSGVSVNSGASLDLQHCTLSGNSAVAVGGYKPNDGCGGGLVNLGTVTLDHCILSGNSAIASNGSALGGGHGLGGGIYNLGTATLNACTLSGNSLGGGAYGFYVGSNGGGLYNGGTVTLTSCTFSANSATATSASAGQGNGGGLYNDVGCTATLTACTFTNNSAAAGGDPTGNDGLGGGLYNFGTVMLTGCAFSGNTANGGGGLYNDFNSAATLTACLLTGNNGGGVWDYVATAALIGCTLSGNSGGGIHSAGSTTTLTLTDDILWGDGGEVYTRDSPVDASFCDIQGGYAGTGNFNADPLFDREQSGYAGSTPYALQPGSPCVGAGAPSQAGTQDITGATRANPPTVGAYEGQKANTRTTLTPDINPSVYGQAVTFTATVVNTATGVPPTGTVQFTANGAPLTLFPGSIDASGKAIVTAFSLPTGSDTIQAVYSGDATHNGGSATFIETVLVSDTTALASSLNPSVYGQSVMFTASVSTHGGPAPVGSVQFTANGANLGGPVTLGANGTASVSTSSLPTGPVTVTAAFTGSGFQSSGATLTQTVLIANTTTLTSSQNPSPAGQSVTFTATVSTHGGPAPVGGVQFAVDGVSAGSPVPLSGTSASFATSALAIGGHTVTAAFTGSGFQSSSDSLNQNVTVSVGGSQEAHVTGVSAQWGSQTVTLTPGASLLPSGRGTDVPWAGIASFAITLDIARTLTAADVTVHGITVADYGPVSVSGSGTSYTVTLARPISAPDRVTLSLGNADVVAFSGTLPVLPGDVNGDGAVNASDVTLVKNAIGGAYSRTDDIDGSGAVDAADYSAARARVGAKLP